MSELVDHVLELLEPMGDVSARRMFGGHGFFRKGVMFALESDDVLYFKVDDITRPEFDKRDLTPFEYARSGDSITLSYRMAPEEAMNSSKGMCSWAENAYEAAVRTGTPNRVMNRALAPNANADTPNRALTDTAKLQSATVSGAAPRTEVVSPAEIAARLAKTRAAEQAKAQQEQAADAKNGDASGRKAASAKTRNGKSAKAVNGKKTNGTANNVRALNGKAKAANGKAVNSKTVNGKSKPANGKGVNGKATNSASAIVQPLNGKSKSANGKAVNGKSKPANGKRKSACNASEPIVLAEAAAKRAGAGTKRTKSAGTNGSRARRKTADAASLVSDDTDLRLSKTVTRRAAAILTRSMLGQSAFH